MALVRNSESASKKKLSEVKVVSVNRSEQPAKAKVPISKNGLADRLSSLLRKRQSDASVWDYQTKMGRKIDQPGLEVILKKELHRDNACVVFECATIDHVDAESISKIWIIFGHDTISRFGLDEDKKVIIFEPYLRLSSDKVSCPALVGPNFLRIL